MRRSSCPFCPHEKHDGRDCEHCLPRECCGANEQERIAFDAPEEILDWLRELIEMETWAPNEVEVTEVLQHSTRDEGWLEIETRYGRWKLKLEKAS